MPTRASREEGWPEPGSNEREWLDYLYWGDAAGLPPPPDGTYYLPLLSAVTNGPFVTWRHGGDVLTDRMSSFIRGWKQWRRRGASPERRKERGEVRLKENYRGDYPAPSSIAFWVEKPKRKRRSTNEVRDHRNPRPE